MTERIGMGLVGPGFIAAHHIDAVRRLGFVDVLAVARHKNDLRIELNGRKLSVAWRQERQNELWLGYHDRASALLANDPSLLHSDARNYAHLPGGHQEGWADAFRNVIADAYTRVRAGAATQPPPTVCTFADATHVQAVIDAVLTSAAEGSSQAVHPHQELSA